MSCEGIDLFQTYYKYKDRNTSKTLYTSLSNFRHVDFQHKLQDELVLFELHAEFTTYKELREQIDNLVDFLNLYGHKIKLTFIVENNLSNTVARVNKILSKTTSNLLYVSIFIEQGRYPICRKFKFPLRMKLLHIYTGSNKNIYSKLFIDTDAEEYPCLIFNKSMSSMLPEKYIDYTKITSLITRSFISSNNNINCCVNLRNLCIDAENTYCPRSHNYLKHDCFQSFIVLKKMECLMLWHMSDCECNIKQIDHIPYYCFLTDKYIYVGRTRSRCVKFKRNRIVKKNNTISVPYEIECRIIDNETSRNTVTLRHNRFPHVLRLSKVLPKTIFYSILKLFLQHN